MKKKSLMCGLLSVCMLLYCQLLLAQAGTVEVSGRVTDSTGSNIAGVSITQGGKVIGLTNDAGNFSVNATSGSALQFSSVGYSNARYNVRAAATGIRIIMLASSSELDQVVVTALGISRKEMALGYAATTLTSEDLTDARSANWTDALSGKVAGLNLIRSGSGPTASNKIILRGENNLTGDNEALIVLDGVVINQGSGRRTSIGGETVYGVGSDNMPVDYGSSINDINPDDIESVTVLKGPGASALYGQRGANGAIIITTKSGSSKRKGLGVTFSSNASMEEVNRWPDLQYEYGQGLGGASYYSFGTTADGSSTSATSSAYGPRFNGQQFFQFDPLTQTVGAQRTPWVPYSETGVNSYFRKGYTYTNSISLEGGNEKTSARLGFTNVNNSWIMPNTGYKRNTIALSVNSKVNDKLQISSKVNYTNKFSDNLPGAGYGNQSVMYWYIFWQPNADIDWLRNYWRLGNEGRRIMYPFSSFPENPFAIAYEFLNSSNRHNVTGNVSGNWQIIKDLSLQVRASTDLSYEQRAQKRPYDAGSKLQKGSYRTQNIFSNEFSGDLLLTYNKQVNEDWNVSLMGGTSMLRNKYNKDENRADSLIYPGNYSFSNAAGPLVAIPYKSEYAINSVYGLLTTSFKKIAFLDITGRQDWNSVLATPSRTTNAGFFYPSANLSFILSNAINLPKAINYAKLRASASSVGSGGTTPYLTAYNYQPVGNLFAGGLQSPSLLANPDLRPLRTTTYEAGAELKLFNSRIGIDVAVYVGNTKDQHLRRIIDRSSGYSQVLINAGRVQNRGLELAMNGWWFKKRNGFSWQSNLVFSTNKNVIKELLDSSVVLQTGPVGGGQLVATVGGSMGDLYGRGYVRSPDGQVVYDASTGNALINPNVVYLGNTIPKYKVGFGNEFSYKGFKLNVLFDGQFGGVAHSLMHYKLAEQGKTTNTLPGRYNGIIGNGVVLNSSGKYDPNTTVATNIDEYYRSHFGIDNAEGSTFSTDFIKFREARIEYSFASSLTKKLKLQRATIGLYGRDLFIWSPWPMFDPEFGTLSNTDIVRGFETAQFPSTRSLGANLIVSF